MIHRRHEHKADERVDEHGWPSWVLDSRVAWHNNLIVRKALGIKLICFGCSIELIAISANVPVRVPLGKDENDQVSEHPHEEQHLWDGLIDEGLHVTEVIC